ncbi:MAG: GNAT family N-acetyltransferase [Hyphomicrobiales bacterium]|nr:GNAT family N-acetyltransferase [Hyphomicrobiales bacterium]
MIHIRRFADVAHRQDVRTAIDSIFFDNAATHHFADADSRRHYHDLWLQRYLRHFPESSLVAMNEDGPGEIVGYLAGSLVSDRPPLPGPDYYRLFPDYFIDKFPAHIHVNVRKDSHNKGIGRMLIDAFRLHCRDRRAPGFHAVTRSNRCPAHFFTRCGMDIQSRVLWHESQIVFIAEEIIIP